MANQTYMKNPSLYDLFTFGSKALEKRQQFYFKEVKNSKEILEVGAGTGSVALYLADKGKSITCVEPSPSVFINLCAKVFNSEKYKQKVTLHPMKISQVKFPKVKFDHIIISNVMPYIHSENERDDLLQKAKRLASAKGKLIATFFTERMAVKKRKEFDAEMRIGNGIVKRYSSNIPFLSKKFVATKFTWVFETYNYGRHTQTIREDFILRCDKKQYVEKLLHRNGWYIESIFSDYDRHLFDQTGDSQVMIVIANHKNGE